jgi:hypothetical protein
MTVPNERTRALRYGWEYLSELRDADNMTKEQRRQIELILRHYPSPAEIKRWALMDSMRVTEQHTWSVCQLAPEKESALSRSPVSAEPLDRGPTAPSERARALRLAERFITDLESETNLTESQKLQIPYVLRHFPRQHEIAVWARTEADLQRNAAPDSGFVAWLAPQDIPPVQGQR